MLNASNFNASSTSAGHSDLVVLEIQRYEITENVSTVRRILDLHGADDTLVGYCSAARNPTTIRTIVANGRAWRCLANSVHRTYHGWATPFSELFMQNLGPWRAQALLHHTGQALPHQVLKSLETYRCDSCHTKVLPSHGYTSPTVFQVLEPHSDEDSPLHTLVPPSKRSRLHSDNEDANVPPQPLDFASIAMRSECRGAESHKRRWHEEIVFTAPQASSTFVNRAHCLKFLGAGTRY